MPKEKKYAPPRRAADPTVRACFQACYDFLNRVTYKDFPCPCDPFPGERRKVFGLPRKLPQDAPVQYVMRDLQDRLNAIPVRCGCPGSPEVALPHLSVPRRLAADEMLIARDLYDNIRALNLVCPCPPSKVVGLPVPTEILFTLDSYPAAERYLWRLSLDGSVAENIGTWTAASCGFTTFEYPWVRAFHPDSHEIILVDNDGLWIVSGAGGTPCPVEIVAAAGIQDDSGAFDFLRDRVYYFPSGNTMRYVKRDGTGDTELINMGWQGSDGIEYDWVRDRLYMQRQSNQTIYVYTLGDAVPALSSVVSKGPLVETFTINVYDNELLWRHVAAGVNYIRRYDIETATTTDINVGGVQPVDVLWHPTVQKYYFTDSTGALGIARRRVHTVDRDGNLETIYTHPNSVIRGMRLAYWN